MTQLYSHALLRTTKTKTTTTFFILCSILLGTLGATAILEELNYISYTTVNAQLVDTAELRKDLRTAIVEKELQKGMSQNQTNQSASAATTVPATAPAPTSSPNGLTLSLDRAHFVPLSPLSDSPGNQVKMLLDYSVQNSSEFLNDKVNAVMEVYAANQTLLKTSSLPEPVSLANSEGSIQLATTFSDPTLQNVTVRALLTDGQKILPISDPIEESIGLGESIAIEGTLFEVE
jgi:hypothetical protein